MEEWTELIDEEDDDDGNAEGKCGFSFDLEFDLGKYRFDSSKERLRGLFDQVLVAFMREKSASKCIRPIPALCGDGRPVDLFKLFWVVRKIGGHDTVSRNDLWDFVSEECGLDHLVVPSIKLIHMKYLNELDRWLEEVFSKKDLEDRHKGLVQKLDLLSRELKIKFRSFSTDEKKKDTKDSGLVENRIYFFSEKDGKLQNGNTISSKFVASAKRVVEKAVIVSNAFSEEQIDDGSGNSCNEDSISIMGSAKKVVKKARSKPHDISENIIITDDEERFSAQQGIDVMIPSRRDVGDVADSRKRKRESQFFSGMLNWLVHVAKHSNDPSVGLIPECSKWRDYGNGEFWVQAILVREAMRIRRHDNTNASEILLKDQQKKQRMHPSMYEDIVLDHQPTEKQRCSKRIPSLTKPLLCPCCNSCGTPKKKDTTHQEAEVGNNNLKSPQKLVTPDIENPPSNSTSDNPSDLPFEKQVSVGPLFQADVPQWTGSISHSDPKWLGTKMWDPLDGKKMSTVQLDLDSIGKGRDHHLCDCLFPNSVECVRFHIAEKRLRLKQEISVLFYKWRFHHMGEEVSLSWTEEEEKRFKEMMRSFDGFSNKFFANAFRVLSSKTRENLVSYYFNVYLVQRRSYQNRVIPEEVDSDDDEKECGMVGEMFGYKALYVPGSKMISCSLNKESTEMT